MALLPIDWKPERKILKRFGIVSFVIFGLIAAFIWRKGGLFHLSFGDAAHPTALVFAAIALSALAFSFTRPTFNRPLYLALITITYPIGFVMGWVILAFFFFILITPTGFILRLGGKDPMRRRYDPSAPTYFDTRTTTPSPTRYLRQY